MAHRFNIPPKLLQIFRVKSEKNLHWPKKIDTGAAHGARDKYEVWSHSGASFQYTAETLASFSLQLFCHFEFGVNSCSLLFFDMPEASHVGGFRLVER